MFDTMAVTVPEGVSGNVKIRRITAGPPSLRDLIRMDTRIVPEGFHFTALYRNGDLWMSDTPAERRDHYPAMRKAQQLSARRVLINGLGLGMIVNGLLTLPHVEHIDVVEIDEDVIALVADHYQRMATSCGKTVSVYQDDAYTIRWKPGTSWDIAWSDVWLTACTDNLPEMTRLSRKYGRRVRWHGHWFREELMMERREDQRYKARRRQFMP